MSTSNLTNKEVAEVTQVSVRIPLNKKKKCMIAAAQHGMSVNVWIKQLIDNALEKSDSQA